MVFRQFSPLELVFWVELGPMFIFLIMISKPGSFQFIVYDVGPSHIVHAPIASTGHNGVLSFQISGIAVIGLLLWSWDDP